MDEIEARVREMIRTSDIPAEVTAALQDALRYSIRLHTALANDDQLALGATKIGGQPDLPPDVAWPEWRGAPLNFLAQIRLADIVAYDPDGELPHDGTLSFFFDYQRWFKPELEREGSLATVLYIPEGIAIARMPWPEALDMRERYTPLAITSHTRELTAPTFEGPTIEQCGYTWSSMYGPKATPESEAETERIQDLLIDVDKYLHASYGSRGQVHRLLGHADEIQYGVEYDWQRAAKAITESESAPPDFGAIHKTGWRLLLQVVSDENGMTWGDLGRIYFGLPRQALALHEVSQTIAELQCT